MRDLEDELKNLYNIRTNLEDRAYELMVEGRYGALKVVIDNYSKADNMIRVIEHKKVRERELLSPEPFWYLLRRK